MRTIRYGSFETNSSSTHAIVIPKEVDEENYSLYDSLDHDYGFGRGESRLVNDWDEKLAYAYMVIKDFYNRADEDNSINENIQKFKDTINNIYNELQNPFSVKPNDVFESIEKEERLEGFMTFNDGWYRPYVDHSYELCETDFIERLLNDYDFTKRFIFNTESYITIGGDEYRGFNIKTIGFEYDYKNSKEFWNKLEEYKKDNDVYLKGN